MKIIIAGGGTAGWLAALFVKKVKPEHDVVVIESSKIGIIGAGEGSTGTLMDVITNHYWDFGCDINDFVKETGASFKYGIKHINWTGDNSYYYGPLDGSPTMRSLPDHSLFAGYLKDSKWHTLSDLGFLMENSISHYDPNQGFTRNVALHFDAHKVGKYFKKVIMKDKGISHIDSEILEVKCNNLGIESLLLSNGDTIQGDFFIDATGFKRVLMNALGNDWVSYKKHLPVNTAMPFLLDYKEGETPKPYTTAWAHSAGWMWQIPTRERKGCGYVFSDEFISREDAQKEIETSLGQEIEPIRFFNFDTGRLDNAWMKNCLAVGLSSAFAEPLEATSIHSTIVQLHKFVFEYLKPTKESTINLSSVKQYNKHTARMYDDFKDFLVTHYISGRQDSEFWKYIQSGATKTEFVKDLLDMCKTRVPTFNDFNEYFGAAGWPLYAWVLLGTKAIDPALAKSEISISVPEAESLYNASMNGLEQHKLSLYDKYQDHWSFAQLISSYN